MTIAITLTVLAFIILPMLGAMWGAADRNAGFGAWFGFALAFNLSLAGWVVYVVIHFAAKFW